MRGRGKSLASRVLTDAARDILAEIHPATVRAVCYRLFVSGFVASMAKNETNKVSRLLVQAREDGIVPWNWIVDETRSPESVSTWSSPREIFEACARAYRFDYWRDQPVRIEVWSEKGTVRGTLAPVLDRFAVTLRVMHGHASATAVHDAAETSLASSDRPLVVLYVGDRDPSGMHMSEVDLPERIARYGGSIAVERIAIVEEDTQAAANVPSFEVMTKTADPRFGWYLQHYGARCWELDALNPPVLRARVERCIRDRIDVEAWRHAMRIEAAQREATERYVAGLPPSIFGQAPKYSTGEADCGTA